jgi:hypothetical protein
MKMTVDELIAKLQEISASGDGNLPVAVPLNEAHETLDLCVVVCEPREAGPHSMPMRVVIDEVWK